MTAFRLLSLLALGVTCHLAASDVSHGLWLSIGSLPRDYETETKIDGVRATGEDTFDSAGRLAVGYRGRLGAQVAFVIDAGLAFSSEEQDDAEIGGLGAIIAPGVSFRVAPRFEIDVTVPLGFGGARIDTEGEDADSDTGAYGEIGLLVRPSYVFANGLQLSAELGVLGRRQEFTFDTAAGDVEATIESGGFVLGLGVGYRF